MMDDVEDYAAAEDEGAFVEETYHNPMALVGTCRVVGREVATHTERHLLVGEINESEKNVRNKEPTSAQEVEAACLAAVQDEDEAQAEDCPSVAASEDQKY